MICLGNTEEAVMLKNLLKNNLHPSEDLQLSNSVDSHSLLDDKIDASDKAGHVKNLVILVNPRRAQLLAK